MIQIQDKKKCTGCSACYNICPMNAIIMKEDKEGFLYPNICVDKCIDCGKCISVCPYYHNPEPFDDLKLCYAAFNNNPSERAISSSGGIFIALANYIIKNNGIVFGAAYDESFLVYHTFAKTKEELIHLVGSKYMQSRIGESFKLVKSYLESGKAVLFAGTTCQIGGLKNYLIRDYEHLLTVDFICLGVPSPRVWSDYLNTYFKRDEISLINFKDKSLGWHNFSLRIKGKEEFCRDGRKTYFFSGYFKQLYSRPSCSACIFKEGNRVSDITISDCWGYTHIAPEMDDNKGLSCIVCHSDNGQKLFEEVQAQLIWKKIRFDDVQIYNSNYYSSAASGKSRELFWKKYDRLPKSKLFERFCKPDKPQKCMRIRKVLHRIKKNVKHNWQ